MLRLILLSTVAAIIPATACADPILTPVLVSAGLSSSVTIGTATITLASVVSQVIVGGALFGLSQLFKPDTSQKVSPQQFQVKQSQPALLYGYGRTKLGGAKFIYETAAGALIDGIVHCAGPIDGFDKWYCNDKDSGIASDHTFGTGFGGANVAQPWAGYVSIESHKGLRPETACFQLTQLLPNFWTSNHRLDGLAYSVSVCALVKEKIFQTVYGSGTPSISVLARMAPVYDPRSSSQVWSQPQTFKWSDNPALAVLHYLTEQRAVDTVNNKPVFWGFGIPKTRINIESFKAFANVCDQMVGRANASLVKRYTLGGTFNLAQEERRDILAKLLASCDGEIYQDQSGLISIRGGVWTAPTVILDENSIIDYNLAFAQESDEGFNRLKISFADALNDYNMVEGDPLDDTLLQNIDGKIIEQDFTLPMVNEHTQARRLAKIALKKGNPAIFGTIITNLSGLNALFERTITVQIAELGISTSFLIKRFVENDDDCTCTIELASLDASAYTWDAASEDGVAPVPSAANRNQATVTVPTISVKTVETIRVTTAGTVTGLRARVTVNPPTDTNFELQGQWRIFVSGSGAEDNWQDMSQLSDYVEETPDQPDNTQVQYRLAWWGPLGGTRGAWTAPASITLQADATAPGVATNLSLTEPSTKTMRVGWTTPNSANYKSTLLQVATYPATTTFNTMTTQYGSSNTAYTFDTTSYDIGAYTVRVVSQNPSGVQSIVTAGTLYLFDRPGNLIVDPYNFASTSWTKQNVVATQQTASAASGNKVWAVLADNATNGVHLLSLLEAVNTPAGATVKGSIGIGVPTNPRRYVLLRLSTADQTEGFDVTYDTQTKSVVATNAYGGATGASVSLQQVTATFTLVKWECVRTKAGSSLYVYMLSDAQAGTYAGGGQRISITAANIVVG